MVRINAMAKSERKPDIGPWAWLVRFTMPSSSNKAGATEGAPRTRAKGWVTWKENGKIVLAERQGAPSSLEVGESDDEDCEITAVTHVSDPVASLDLCQVCG